MSPCSDFVALLVGCAFQQSVISLKQESAGTTSWVYDFIMVVDLHQFDGRFNEALGCEILPFALFDIRRTEHLERRGQGLRSCGLQIDALKPVNDGMNRLIIEFDGFR